MFSETKQVERRGRSFGVMMFVFPGCTWWSQDFLGITEHLPAHEKWMNPLFFFTCYYTFLLYWLDLSVYQCTEFFHFRSSNSLLIPRKKTAGAAWGWAAGWGGNTTVRQTRMEGQRPLHPSSLYLYSYHMEKHFCNKCTILILIVNYTFFHEVIKVRQQKSNIRGFIGKP